MPAVGRSAFELPLTGSGPRGRLRLKCPGDQAGIAPEGKCGQVNAEAQCRALQRKTFQGWQLLAGPVPQKKNAKTGADK